MSVVKTGLLHFCQKDLQKDGKSRGGSGIYGESPRCQQLQEKIERRDLCHVRGQKEERSREFGKGGSLEAGSETTEFEENSVKRC